MTSPFISKILVCQSAFILSAKLSFYFAASQLCNSYSGQISVGLHLILHCERNNITDIILCCLSESWTAQSLHHWYENSLALLILGKELATRVMTQLRHSRGLRKFNQPHVVASWLKHLIYSLGKSRQVAATGNPGLLAIGC